MSKIPPWTLEQQNNMLKCSVLQPHHAAYSNNHLYSKCEFFTLGKSSRDKKSVYFSEILSIFLCVCVLLFIYIRVCVSVCRYYVCVLRFYLDLCVYYVCVFWDLSTLVCLCVMCVCVSVLWDFIYIRVCMRMSYVCVCVCVLKCIYVCVCMCVSLCVS